MKGWKEDELGRVANYAKEKIDAKSLDASTYVSTENMLPDICGIVPSSYLPKDGKVLGFENGDVLVSNIRPYFKKIWRAKYAGGCSNDILVFRSDVSKILPEFLYYQLAQNDFFDFMMAGANGVKMPRGNRDLIPKFKFKLPPLPTQKKIARILSAYDDLIENNLRRIKLLEEMAQITYEEWFVHLRFPGHTTTPINPTTGLPDGWKKVRLGDMCHLTMGQSPKSEFYNTDGNGLPFHQGVKDYGERFPSNASWSTEGARYAERGDVLFSVRAPVGRLNIALEKMILGRGLAAICHKQKAQGFLYCLLKKQFFAEDMMGGGAIFNSVTKNDMLRIDVVQPDENTLQKFNQIVSASDREIEVLHIQNQRLREARDILLPRLMTGVIDAEKYQPENLLKKN